MESIVAKSAIRRCSTGPRCACAHRRGRGTATGWRLSWPTSRCSTRASASPTLVTTYEGWHPVTVGWRALSRLVMPDRLSSEPAISGGRCSFFVRHVDCGSSNVAEAELMSLVGPVYNLEGYGIRFVSSPSQADALLMTGPPTENMLGPALAAFAVMPEPKAIV